MSNIQIISNITTSYFISMHISVLAIVRIMNCLVILLHQLFCWYEQLCCVPSFHLKWVQPFMNVLKQFLTFAVYSASTEGYLFKSYSSYSSVLHPSFDSVCIFFNWSFLISNLILKSRLYNTWKLGYIVNWKIIHALTFETIFNFWTRFAREIQRIKLKIPDFWEVNAHVAE